MKRIAIVILIMLLASTALAMSRRPHKPDNWNMFGSDDRQHNHQQATTPVPVPEPSTLILLGTGIVGLAAWSRKR